MKEAPPEGLRARPHVLSIPAGVAFLETLADGLLDGGLIGRGFSGLRNDPLALSDVRIFLPTRRAVRELQSIFVTKLGGAALLPQIVPLGDYDDEEDAFSVEPLPDTDSVKPAIGETERRLVLATLIQAWAKSLAAAIQDQGEEAHLIGTSPSEAIALAIELGRLIDSFDTEGANWTEIAPLISPEHDTVWKITADFLEIAAKAWPIILEERDAIGAAARRNALLRATGEKLLARMPTAPVIVAGSTGSNPATVDLMRAVGRLPNGVVVLQGLDTDADEATWAEIGGEHDEAAAWTHPQHGFFRLLQRLDVQRTEVGILGREKALEARQKLVSTALLPSNLTDRWQKTRLDAHTALEGVTIIEAANEREEALAIALTLVDALRDPTKTAALITPDRPLARRVAVELQRFGVEAGDSAGLPLTESETGIFARLLAETAAEHLAAGTLLPLLRHSLAGFGMEPHHLARATDVLEIGVLRGPAPDAGLDGLRKALAITRDETSAEEKRFWHPAKSHLSEDDWGLLEQLLSNIAEALNELCAYAANNAPVPLGALAAAHRKALHSGIRVPDSHDHTVLDKKLEELESASLPVRLRDYPSVLTALLAGETSRSTQPVHPRLRILGTLEARLLGFDRVVLGGLNETIWPPQASNDAFLSRPMRAALGLPPPEWRVGLSAHDFEQALGGRDVVVTRSAKTGGSPSVAARWLQRLAAVSGKTAWQIAIERGNAYLAMARTLDEAEHNPLGKPAPVPPTELLPHRLSITDIETLIRDPYAIYAKYVLKIAPLDPLCMEPGASDRGTLIHAALATFITQHDVYRDDAGETLLNLGREGFEPYWSFPDVRLIWWPRFERIAQWFITWERARRRDIDRTYVEMRGSLTWPTDAGREFTLSGRADRLDQRRDGLFDIIDYKTGKPPTDDQVRSGLSPQLPLEAAILAADGFKGIPGARTGEYLYLHLHGRGSGGDEKRLKMKDTDENAVAFDCLNELKGMINRFESGEPFRPGTHPTFRRRPNGDYDHLARLAEWALAPDGGEDGE